MRIHFEILGFEELFEVIGVEAIPFVDFVASSLGSAVEHLHHVFNAKVLSFRQVVVLEMVEDESAVFLYGIGVFVLIFFGFERGDKSHLLLDLSGCLLADFIVLSAGEERNLAVEVGFGMRIVVAVCE